MPPASPPPSFAAHQYGIEPLRLRLFYAIAAVIAAIGLVLALFFLWVVGTLGLDLVGMIVVAVPIVLFGGIALAIVLATGRTRLELSDVGLTLQLPGTTMTTEWENVEAIAPVFWGPLTGDGIKLRKPARVRRGWWFTVFADPGFDSAIPLSPFALPLAGSRLEADLRIRLPHLFDGGTSGR